MDDETQNYNDLAFSIAGEMFDAMLAVGSVVLSVAITVAAVRALVMLIRRAAGSV